MASFKRSILEQLYERQNGICFYCDQKTEMPKSKSGPFHDLTATIEHIVPKVVYHTYDLDKLAMTCSRCNLSRLIIPFSVYIKLIGKDLEKVLVGFSEDPLWRILLDAPFKDGEPMPLPNKFHFQELIPTETVEPIIEPNAVSNDSYQEIMMRKRKADKYPTFPNYNFP